MTRYTVYLNVLTERHTVFSAKIAFSAYCSNNAEKYVESLICMGQILIIK